jgi:glutaconate CoA-transferase, subunit A
MGAKRASLREAVDGLEDGMTIGIGGWAARRKPMALVREICRSPVRDLTVVSYGGPDVGLLCAAGKVRRLIFGFVSLDGIPLEPHFRRAREEGRIEAVELDEGMLQWGLYAAGLKLPFLPTRAGLASDVMRINPDLRTVESPYEDRETLVAMPALELDVALVHANYADERGNAQVLGPDFYFDDLYCAAAKRRIVSCERIVATSELNRRGCVHTLMLHRGLVDAVVEAPQGAHPTSCAPEYGVDHEHLRTYADAAEPERWEAYRDRFLTEDEDRYRVEVAEGSERAEAGTPAP